MQSTLRLNDVIRLQPRDKKKVEPSVIAIPCYCTPPLRNWSVREEIEKAALPLSSISHVSIYMYQYKQETSNSFSWEKFLRAGNDLADNLAHLTTEALLLAHQNMQDARFKQVVDCLSGILFLGTPHAGITDEDTLLRYNQILFSCSKVNMPKQTAKKTRDSSLLGEIGATFEQIANVPILSVYQRGEIRSLSQKFLGRKGKLPVDKALATINSSEERLLGVNLPHSELCQLHMLKDETFSARDFLHDLLEELSENGKWSSETGSLRNVQGAAPDTPGSTNATLTATPALTTQNPSADEARPCRKGMHKSTMKLPLRLHLISNTSSEHLLDARTAKLPCFMLSQSPNPDFVGRDTVFEEMDKYLLPRMTPDSGNAQSTQFFALCGLGGIGKTDIAVQYAFTRRKKFGAVFWLEAAGVSQLASDFGRISTQLGLESREEAKDLESSIEIAKAWLTRPRNDDQDENDSWLLIFDNADNLDIILDYIPFHGNGSVLVTSRDPYAKEHFFSNGSGVDVEPLSIEDSAALLRKLIIRSDQAYSTSEDAAAVELANHLAGLPLAVTQIAGFIRRRHLSIEDFVQLYASDARYAEIRNVSSPLQDHRYGYTLATAFNFEDVGSDASRLLAILAFLSPDRIREDIFRRQESSIGQSAEWSAITFENARYELLTSSIIRRNILKRELCIHRVVQAEVRTRMDEAARHSTFQTAISMLATIWPQGDLCSQTVKRRKLCEDLIPHLERFYQLYIEYREAWQSYEIGSKFPMLLNEAAVYHHERGFPHEGKAYLKLALQLCQSAGIVEEPLISSMHLTMGALSNETNDAAACLEHNIICLNIRRGIVERTQKPDLGFAFAHSQMGIAYMMVREVDQATEYFKQSVELLEAINVDADEYGFPVCNLGLAYWIQGELDAADETLTQLLAQRESIHGKMDKVSYKTGRVLQALGNVKSSKARRLQNQGDLRAAQRLWDQAFAIHSDCLDQYESTLGKSNHRTADACHKLAEHHIRLGNDALAQAYLDRALSIWGDKDWFKNESARSSFLRAEHLLSLGGNENLRMGERWLERAILLRSQLVSDRPAQDEETKILTTTDFDDLVCFWSL